jgi:hypothetical protein
MHGPWIPRTSFQRFIFSSRPTSLSQAHGYATHEFEVTPERLGVYLPVCTVYPHPHLLSLAFFNTQTEHIDNPRGYGEGEDARQYHPKLRPPVDVRPNTPIFPTSPNRLTDAAP